MPSIIGVSDKKAIGDIYFDYIDNFYMNTNMKYPDFSKRLNQAWKECDTAKELMTALSQEKK